MTSSAEGRLRTDLSFRNEMMAPRIARAIASLRTNICAAGKEWGWSSRLKSRFFDSYSDEDKDPWNRYSAAVGMAEYTQDDDSFDAVFKRADKAMYEDKMQFKDKYGTVR